MQIRAANVKEHTSFYAVPKYVKFIELLYATLSEMSIGVKTAIDDSWFRYLPELGL
jgi:hypothetical protein